MKNDANFTIESYLKKINTVMKVGDITKSECDAIINPIGHKYQFKGGACTAILKAFGS